MFHFADKINKNIDVLTDVLNKGKLVRFVKEMTQNDNDSR